MPNPTPPGTPQGVPLFYDEGTNTFVPMSGVVPSGQTGILVGTYIDQPSNHNNLSRLEPSASSVTTTSSYVASTQRNGLVSLSVPFTFDPVQGTASIRRNTGGPASDDAILPANVQGQDARSFPAIWRGDTNVWQRKRSAVLYATLAKATTGSTALLAAVPAKRWRLMGYMIEVTSNAATAGGAVITASLLDVAASIGLANSFFIPSAAGTTLNHRSTPWIMLGQGHPAAAVNTALNFNLTAALTAGTFRVNIAYTQDD